MGTILRDIVDGAKDITDLRGEIFKSTTKRRTSLSKLASDAILQNPVICSNGVSINGMSIITKALERHYSSFILIVTSLNSVTDKLPIDYIKQYHQNKSSSLVSIAGDILDNVSEATIEITYDDIKNNVLNESEESIFKILTPMKNIVHNLSLAEAICNKYDDELNFNEEIDSADGPFKRYTLDTLPKKYMPVVYKFFKQFSENYHIINFNEEVFLAEKTTSGVFGVKMLADGNIVRVLKTVGTIDEKCFNHITESGIISTNKTLLQEWECPFNLDILNESSHNISTHKIFNNFVAEETLNERYTKTTRYKKVKDDDGNDMLEKSSEEEVEYKSGDDYDGKYGYLKSSFATHTRLTDNDVKKANELIPTILTIQQVYRNGDTNTPVSYNIGIKAVLHPVSSEDMIKNLSNGILRNRKFFNFLRWTTGEISFWKDLVFAIDSIRDDVISKYNGSSHWWSTLTRRKLLSKLKTNFLPNSNQILPNATIVCSMEEVDFMKKEYNIDLYKSVSNVLKLMDTYFLLGFCIVDEASELAYFLFDGEKSYQTYSFSSLERENSNKAKETQDIMRVLSKM